MFEMHFPSTFSVCGGQLRRPIKYLRAHRATPLPRFGPLQERKPFGQRPPRSAEAARPRPPPGLGSPRGELPETPNARHARPDGAPSGRVLEPLALRVGYCAAGRTLTHHRGGLPLGPIGCGRRSEVTIRRAAEETAAAQWSTAESSTGRRAARISAPILHILPNLVSLGILLTIASNKGQGFICMTVIVAARVGGPAWSKAQR